MKHEVRTWKEKLPTWLALVALWAITLHFGFDLGRHQGFPHGLVHDVLPASLGLGTLLFYVTEPLQTIAWNLYVLAHLEARKR
jgi:hypothetical protein